MLDSGHVIIMHDLCIYWYLLVSVLFFFFWCTYKILGAWKLQHADNPQFPLLLVFALHQSPAEEQNYTVI